jgi:hypothetical protein
VIPGFDQTDPPETLWLKWGDDRAWYGVWWDHKPEQEVTEYRRADLAYLPDELVEDLRYYLAYYEVGEDDPRGMTLLHAILAAVRPTDGEKP